MVKFYPIPAAGAWSRSPGGRRRGNPEWRAGGGAVGALSHAVIHSLDVTIALDRPAVAPKEAVLAVLEQAVAARGAWFGIDLTDVRLEASDTGWSWGDGRLVRADSGSLVALLGGRVLPDGRTLRRD